MSQNSDDHIAEWVLFIQSEWLAFRKLAAENYHFHGRGAFWIDLAKELQLFSAIMPATYVTRDNANALSGLSSYLLVSRIQEYNPERELLFYFWDEGTRTATPRVLRENVDGTPTPDFDAIWRRKERRCPKCDAQFSSVGDRGQCPKCAHVFFASGRVRGIRQQTGPEIPPIVEVVTNTSTASDMETLLDLIYEKRNIRGDSNLTRVEQAIVDVVEMDGQVCNGGFAQYFGNTFGERAREAIATLLGIGAKQAAIILERACSVYPNGMPSTDKEERIAEFDTLGEETSELWDRLDNEYFAVNVGLRELLWNYWLQHKERLGGNDAPDA